MADLFLIDRQPEASQTDANQQATPPDASEREQALETTRSWIVEAPAGSGKTGLLIQRYLKLLAAESVETPDQVLAITFTNKATAELRERVIARLEKAAENAAPSNEFDRLTQSLARAVLARDRALNWNILDQPDRLNIRTIDSLCAEIAGALPLLSGSGGRQSPVTDAEPLYALAAQRTFLQLGGSDPSLNAALRLILLHRDGNLADCEALLGEMLARRDQWGALVPLGRRALDDEYLDSTVLPLLQHALEHAIRTAITQLSRTIPQDLLERLCDAAAEMAHLDGYNGAPSPIALCAHYDDLPGLASDDLAHWRALMHLLVSPSQKAWRRGFNSNHVGFVTTKHERDRLKALVEELHHRDDLLHAILRLGALPPATYPAEQWVVAKALFRILSHALIELKLVFAERGECDFTEIALAAQTALRSGLGNVTDEGTSTESSGDILAAALGLRLQHLLVDEMQDTSSSQYELIRMLTQGWDGYSQTVFLVGDPKQSIYLFRQARVERFLHTMRSRSLGDLPLGCLRLTANFRSQELLVAQFNHDFAQIFPSQQNTLHPEEVPFVAADPVRLPSLHAVGRIWHPSLAPGARAHPVEAAQARHTQRREEAVAIRRIVEQWRAKPLPPSRQTRPGKQEEPWKIAVLVRTRSHAAEIIRALQETPEAAPIPFRAIEIDALKERPEVQDLFALTRALLHPADRVAWLAVMHAPWCGFGLRELHILTGADDPTWAERSLPDLITDRGDLLAPDACQRLERLWPIFQAAAATEARIPTAQRVERTWRSLGGDTYLGPVERTNARRYLQLLDQIEQQTGIVDITQLSRQLDNLYAAPSTEPNAIDILTIHKSKGLEWDLVLIPALDRIGRIDRARLLSWLELDSSAIEEEDAYLEPEDHRAAAILLAPIRSRGEESRELNAWLDGIRREREAAERKRLLYVACTRAREELHLFASCEINEKGGVQPRSGSLLQSFWPAAKLHFDAVAAQPLMPPTQLHEEEDSEALALAAAADPAIYANLLYRLPLDFDPEARLRASRRATSTRISDSDSGAGAPVLFNRPEGSFAARAFGNVVHAFLEKLANALATGQSHASLLADLTSWSPRIAAVLRAEGVLPAQIEHLAQRVLAALQTTLKDPEGAWLLSAHVNASTEFALTTWPQEADRSSIRLDRCFLAGPEPLAPGGSYLWIVDYKTTPHGSENLDEFLHLELDKYRPQLETYARMLNNGAALRELRLALYYPMLPKLLWWIPSLAKG